MRAGPSFRVLRSPAALCPASDFVHERLRELTQIRFECAGDTAPILEDVEAPGETGTGAVSGLDGSAWIGKVQDCSGPHHSPLASQNRIEPGAARLGARKRPPVPVIKTAWVAAKA